MPTLTLVGEAMKKTHYRQGTVGALIEELKRDFKMNDPIVFGYWSKEFIQEMSIGEVVIGEEEKYQLTTDDIRWLSTQDYDWSSINEQIDSYVMTIVEEAQQEQTEEQLEEQLWKE